MMGVGGAEIVLQLALYSCCPRSVCPYLSVCEFVCVCVKVYDGNAKCESQGENPSRAGPPDSPLHLQNTKEVLNFQLAIFNEVGAVHSIHDLV
mmetsp:Transcript_59306/g.95915  ORF Transcript_59306/g.95915 Transcript_59306/m.95915 type:complete len:93 (+) Transcript_59306:221-499(+)